jgi:hypothetical protein
MYQTIVQSCAKTTSARLEDRYSVLARATVIHKFVWTAKIPVRNEGIHKAAAVSSHTNLYVKKKHQNAQQLVL